MPRVETVTPQALANAIAAEVVETAKRSNAEAAFHEEAHFQAGLVGWLRRETTTFPIVEAAYEDGRWRERADICLLDGGGDKPKAVAWIELKKSWFGRSPEYQNKPGEQLGTLLWDIAKVAYQAHADGSSGVVGVLFYNQRGDGTRFDDEYAAPGSRATRDEWLAAFRGWCDGYDVGGRDPNRAWDEVFQGLGLSGRLLTSQLRPLYIWVLRHLGEVAIVEIEDLKDDLEYMVVVGRIES